VQWVRALAGRKERLEAEAEARARAELQARQEGIARAQAREAAERQAREEVEARTAAERQAMEQAEARARAEATKRERQARVKAKAEAEAAALAQAKDEAREQARARRQERARLQREAEEAVAQEQAKREAQKAAALAPLLASLPELYVLPQALQERIDRSWPPPMGDLAAHPIDDEDDAEGTARYPYEQEGRCYAPEMPWEHDKWLAMIQARADIAASELKEHKKAWAEARRKRANLEIQANAAEQLSGARGTVSAQERWRLLDEARREAEEEQSARLDEVEGAEAILHEWRCLRSEAEEARHRAPDREPADLSVEPADELLDADEEALRPTPAWAQYRKRRTEADTAYAVYQRLLFECDEARIEWQKRSAFASEMTMQFSREFGSSSELYAREYAFTKMARDEYWRLQSERDEARALWEKVTGYLEAAREAFVPTDNEVPDSDASRYIPLDVRQAVWERDQGRCVACQATGPKAQLQFDHVLPFSKGGANTVKNLQLLCKPCNLKKSNRI
jgi:hypothetical protein